LTSRKRGPFPDMGSLDPLAINSLSCPLMHLLYPHAGSLLRTADHRNNHESTHDHSDFICVSRVKVPSPILSKPRSQLTECGDASSPLRRANSVSRGMALESWSQGLLYSNSFIFHRSGYHITHWRFTSILLSRIVHDNSLCKLGLIYIYTLFSYAEG